MAGSAYFNGSSDQLYVTYNISAWPLSFAAWYYYDGEGGSSGILGFGQSYQKGIGIRKDGTWLEIWSGNAAQAFAKSGHYTMTSGNWYHVVGVMTSDTDKKMYVNGVESVSWTTSRTAPTPTTLLIGAMWPSGSYSRGNFAYAHYYDKALTPEEVLEIMHKPGSVTSNLVGYYPLWENAASISDYKDLSSNGRDMTSGGLPDYDPLAPPVYFPNHKNT